MGAARSAPTSIKSSKNKPTSFSELMEYGGQGKPVVGSGGFGAASPFAGMGRVIDTAFGSSGAKTNFSPAQEEKEEPKDTNKFAESKKVKDDDYKSTKKRLLELAKEEAIKISRGKDIDSKIYRESLPDSSGENQKTAEMFLGKDYKKNVQKSIDDLPTPIQGMFGGGA